MYKACPRLVLILVYFCSIVNGRIFDPDIAECYLKHKRTEVLQKCGALVNDPYLKCQWYLIPAPIPKFENRERFDLGIIDVWIKYRFFGENVSVVVYDDGVKTTHPDLVSNYDPQLGWDYCDDQPSPDPNPPGIKMLENDCHGTLVAGVIAMAMNNEICGVGVAPRVKLGAARIHCNSVNRKDYVFYYLNVLAYSKHMSQIHITVQSLVDISFLVNLPKGWLEVLAKSAREGRGGLGTIHVFSTGNQRVTGTSCSFHRLIQNIYVISVAAISPWDERISPKCASIMVTAPSTYKNPTYFFTTSCNDNCTTIFGGSSAATPLVAGIIALTLSANARLTARDVQHLLAENSVKQVLNQSNFKKNAAKFEVSHSFGFGMINALKLVEKAVDFKSVPELNKCVVPITNIRESGFNSPRVFNEFITTNACQGILNEEVNYLEHVQLEFRMDYTSWHTLLIYLISPHGTTAMLHDEEKPLEKYHSRVKWVIDSVITWGESPRGTWGIIFQDKITNGTGRVYSLELKFYGTREKPEHYF